jgi:hypothetical protein
MVTGSSFGSRRLGAVLGVCSAAALGGAAVAGPYTEPGVAASSPQIAGWATGLDSLVRGPQDIASPGGPLASFGSGPASLGPADGSAVSLGDGGSVTLTFAQPIRDGAGADFAVFENGFAFGNSVFAELGFVEVSSNGTDFFRFPAVSLTQTATQLGAFGGIDPTDVFNLAGKHAGQGTPFDLAALAGVSALLDVNSVTHVRVIDVVGRITPVGTYLPSVDSLGNTINDPYPTAFASGGFDLEAVGVINFVPGPGVAVLMGIGALAGLRRRR